MTEIDFPKLRMKIISENQNCSLIFWVDSGILSFTVSISLTNEDYETLKQDKERAAFLQAALHRPYQLETTRLSKQELRHYLDVILHAPKGEVESFLTKKDQGAANGAISNMLRIKCDKDPSIMRGGQWFQRQN